MQRETDDPDGNTWGQGGLRIIARRLPSGTERVSVAYARNGWLNSSDCGRNHAQSWDMVNSDDHGVNWFGGQIAHVGPSFVGSGGYPWCAVPLIGTLPSVVRGIREFDLANDQVGGARWVALAFDTTVQVYYTTDDIHWTLAHQVTSDSGVAAPSFTWLPSIGVDASGNVAVTYYQWGPPGVVRLAMASAANRFAPSAAATDASWAGPARLSLNMNAGTGFFPVLAALNRRGSDYMSTFAVAPGFLPGGATFMAAWLNGPFPTATPPASCGDGVCDGPTPAGPGTESCTNCVVDCGGAACLPFEAAAPIAVFP